MSGMISAPCRGAGRTGVSPSHHLDYPRPVRAGMDGLCRYPGRCPGLYSFAPSGHHGSPHSASRTAPKLPCTIKHLRSEIPRDAAVRSEIPIRKKSGQFRVPPIAVAPAPHNARQIRKIAIGMSGVLDSVCVYACRHPPDVRARSTAGRRTVVDSRGVSGKAAAPAADRRVWPHANARVRL